MAKEQAQITKSLKTVMLITGTWRLKLTINKFLQILYNIYSVVFQFSFICFFLALVINFPFLFKKQDLQMMMECVGFITIVFVTVSKMIICQSKTVRDLIFQCILEEIRTYKEESHTIQNNYQENVKVLNRVTLMVLLLSWPIISGYCTRTYVDYVEYKNLNESIEKPFVFPIWYPFNANKHYGTALVIATFFAWITIFSIACSQIFYFTLMTQAALQIKALKINALEFHIHNESYKRTVNYNEENRILTVLRNICVKHQSVISFVNELNIAIRNLLLLEFTFNSVNIASVMVQIIILPNTFSMIVLSVFYVLFQIFQVFLISWHANEIQLESISLSDALFQSKWYEQSEKAKKIISIMMLRSKNPMSMFMGPFYPLTISSAINSLKVAYSYIAMIWTLTDK